MEIVDTTEFHNRDRLDDSRHYRMISEKGYVQFSICENKMYAYYWVCPGEGRIFLKELEKYAHDNKLVLIIINNVTNPALEKILKDNYYREYYSDIDGNAVAFDSGIMSFKKDIEKEMKDKWKV